jgi:hypothetical protein
MEESAADSSDSADYGDINSGGEFSSSDTKSRCQSKCMLTRSQYVLNAPDSAYVPMQFNRTAINFIEHSEKYEPMATDAERYDNTASMMSEEDVNQVACLGNTSFHRKGVMLPYAQNYFGNQRAEFLEKNTGDGSFFVRELEGGEAVTKAGVDKEEEKLPAKRVPGRTPKKKTNIPALVVDKDSFNREYKRAVLSYWADPYNEEDVLEYLNIGDATQKRGCSYVKFVRTLYLSLGMNTCCPKST